MSKIGIQNVRYSKMDTSGKYSGAKEIGTLVSFNATPNNVAVTDWGDNRAVESYRTTNQVTLSMELNDLAGAVYADMCGHTYDEETKKITVKDTDNSPYVGIGAIGNSVRNGVNVFVLKFFPKMQFSEPNDENATGTETRTFQHTTIEGTAYPNDAGELKIVQEFDTLAEAQEALTTLLAAPSGVGG